MLITQTYHAWCGQCGNIEVIDAPNRKTAAKIAKSGKLFKRIGRKWLCRICTTKLATIEHQEKK